MFPDSDDYDVQTMLTRIEDILRAHATHSGEEQDNEAYVYMRKLLVGHNSIKNQLPSIVRRFRNLEQFWDFIGSEFSTYRDRRAYIQSEFEPIYDFLEGFEVNSSNADTANLEVLSDGSNPGIDSERTSIEAIDPRKVFVIYGRNSRINQSMFQFLRSIDLKPSEWSQLVADTQSGSPYIGTILEQGITKPQAIIVLLTPDDQVLLDPSLQRDDDPDYERSTTRQARPNVLIEAGMALATDRAHTILVEIGNLRPISDISGIHTVRFDGSPLSRHELVSRLKTTGCAVDTDHSQDWLSVGDFLIEE